MPTTEPELRATTPQEMETEVGKHLKRYRIDTLQLDQKTLAARAGISVRTLRNMELGSGSSLKTFLMVLGATSRFELLLTAFPRKVEEPIVRKKVRSRQRVHKTRNSRASSE